MDCSTAMARPAESILFTGKYDVCATNLSQSFSAHDFYPMTVRLVKVRTQSITPGRGETSAVYFRAYQLVNNEPQAQSRKRKGSLVHVVLRSLPKRRRRNSTTSNSDPSPTYEVPLDRAVLTFGNVSPEEEGRMREITLTYSGKTYRLRSDSATTINELQERIKQTYDKQERSFTGCLLGTRIDAHPASTPASLVFYPPTQPHAVQLLLVDGESTPVDHIKLSSVMEFGVKCTNEVFWMKVDRGSHLEDIEIVHKEANKIADSMSSFLAKQGRVMEISYKSWGTVVTDRCHSMPPPGSHHHDIRNDDNHCYYNVVSADQRGKDKIDMAEKYSSLATQSTPPKSTHVTPEEHQALLTPREHQAPLMSGEHQASADIGEDFPDSSEHYVPMSPVKLPVGAAWLEESPRKHEKLWNTVRERLLNEIKLYRAGELENIRSAGSFEDESQNDDRYINMAAVRKNPPLPPSV